MKAEGIVVAAHGRNYRVEFPGGTTRLCFPRGKKSEIVCGDRVTVECDDGIDSGNGLILDIGARRSLFYRSNAFRKKAIAANLDQLIVLVAAEPSFSTELLTRYLVAAETQRLETLIVLNKRDLPDKFSAALSRLLVFGHLAYRVVPLSARTGAEELRPCLSGRSSLLVGQSGMGKTTLINALIPGTNATTREISDALDSGRHTTTRSALYHLDADSSLIDSPGLQEFGLKHLSFGEIERAFPEFAPFIGKCRFHDCRHDREPDCAIRAALSRGEIAIDRYAAFGSIANDVS
ncbi:MAG: ribosome small subunit-dependent GTPase A [Candidatus Accumulibacter sp.]|nr:ribosome small subunit-dependent GTPase A [Accumulibacter sp.]